MRGQADGDSSAIPLVYLPNNPFTDLIGFCATGFFTIPLAACFSILPSWAWMEGFDAVPVMVSGMPPLLDWDWEPLPSNPPTALLTTPPTADKAAIFALS